MALSLNLVRLLRTLQLVFSCAAIAISLLVFYSEGQYEVYFEMDWYALIAAVFSAALGIYLMVVVCTPLRDERNRYAMLISDCLLVLVWLAGFIGLAVVHGPDSCDASSLRKKYSRVYKVEPGNFCQMSRVNIAFFAITWALFMITCVSLLRDVFYLRQAPGDSQLHPHGSQDDNLESGADPTLHKESIQLSVTPTTSG
uniref:ARAD1B03080p n=1 Tax=Blastobotrys adeninivorans TaxID=409370 RepID=A0A060T4W0_BLAAD